MQACTALAFNLRRKTEFLVALADYSVKCFDTGKEKFKALLCGLLLSHCNFGFSMTVSN